MRRLSGLNCRALYQRASSKIMAYEIGGVKRQRDAAASGVTAATAYRNLKRGGE